MHDALLHAEIRLHELRLTEAGAPHARHAAEARRQRRAARRGAVRLALRRAALTTLSAASALHAVSAALQRLAGALDAEVAEQAA